MGGRTRRDLLASVGACAVLALAGCADREANGDREPFGVADPLETEASAEERWLEHVETLGARPRVTRRDSTFVRADGGIQSEIERVVRTDPDRDRQHWEQRTVRDGESASALTMEGWRGEHVEYYRQVGPEGEEHLAVGDLRSLAVTEVHREILSMLREAEATTVEAADGGAVEALEARGDFHPHEDVTVRFVPDERGFFGRIELVGTTLRNGEDVREETDWWVESVGSGVEVPEPEWVDRAIEEFGDDPDPSPMFPGVDDGPGDVEGEDTADEVEDEPADELDEDAADE